MTPPGAPSLRALLEPRSVAIVGAFARPGSIGQKTIDNLHLLGWTGQLYLVHPSAQEVAGIRCVPAIAELPEAPDCMVAAVSAANVPAVLWEAAARGTKAAVVHAGGFTETGEAGEELQKQLTGICRETGMAVCGPNSIGLVNVTSGAALYGAPLPEEIAAGGVSVVSQSGSVCIALTSTARFGFSHVISSGNEAVVGLDGYISCLADDPATKVIACYVESVRDPEAFAVAAQRAAEAGIPIVALRVGRASRSQRISAAHTGSMAGDDAVYADFFRECSVLQVSDLDELMEAVALMLDVRPVAAGSRVAIVNISGGENVLTADLAEEVSLPLASPSPVTLTTLAANAEGAWIANPVDAGAVMFDLPVYRRWLEALLADPSVGVLAIAQDMPVGLGKQEADTYRRLCEQVADVALTSSKPVLCYSNLAAGLHPQVTQPLRSASVPVLQGARASLAAISRLIALRSAENDPTEQRPPRLRPLTEWVDRLASGPLLGAHEARSFLADHGIPVTQQLRASSADEAAAAADVIGYPVAMKVDAPALGHKTDVGGVMLDLPDAPSVRQAFHAIIRDVGRTAPEAVVQGVLVEPFIASGVEVIVGLARREPFGTVLLVGVGGVLAELIEESALALLPVGRSQVERLIDQTRTGALLDGYRGRERADRVALTEIALQIAAIGEAYGKQIAELDLNPVRVLPQGRGAVVLDAMIVPTRRRSSDHGGL